MSMQHVHTVTSHMMSTPPPRITHFITMLSKALKFVEFSAWAARTKHSSQDFWPFRENYIKLSIHYGFPNDYFMESKTFWISTFRKRNLLFSSANPNYNSLIASRKTADWLNKTDLLQTQKKLKYSFLNFNSKCALWHAYTLQPKQNKWNIFLFCLFLLFWQCIIFQQNKLWLCKKENLWPSSCDAVPTFPKLLLV